MDKKEIEKRYQEVLRRLHTCSAAEKTALKSLLNYYYRRLNNEG